ncbi:DUF58 domain-containing protein [bacterium]|nr:DUF58 domain-containing protein [bacterium]
MKSNIHRPIIGLSLGEVSADSRTPLPNEVRVTEILPGQTAQLPLVRTFVKRGSYRLGVLRLRSDYPLGLVRWQSLVPVGAEQPVIVHPALGKMQPLGRQRLGIQGSGEGKPQTGLLEGIDEFRGVRDYRPGDSSRLIHWRSTARRGSLVVRELDPAAGRGILLVAYLVSARRSTNDRLVDELLSFVSTLVMDVSRDPTLALTLLIVGKSPVVIRGTINSQRVSTYLRALAQAQPTSEKADLDRARHLLDQTDTRDRRYMIVSLDGISPPGSLVWDQLPSRRLLPPIVLNASAGDLTPLWIPPGRLDRPV